MFACISCTVLHVVLKSYLEWTISAIVSVCLHLIRCISRGVEEFILSGLYPPLSMFVCISYIVLHVVLKSSPWVDCIRHCQCLHLIHCTSHGVTESILSGLYLPLWMFACITCTVLRMVLQSPFLSGLYLARYLANYLSMTICLSLSLPCPSQLLSTFLPLAAVKSTSFHLCIYCSLIPFCMQCMHDSIYSWWFSLWSVRSMLQTASIATCMVVPYHLAYPHHHKLH